MSRGFICILSGDFISAFKYNVLSIPIFLGIVGYLILFFIDIFFSKNSVKKVEQFLSKKYMFVVYFVILVFCTILNNI
jgi:hypothetical protein